MSDLHDQHGLLEPSPSLRDVLRLCRALGEGPEQHTPALDVAAVHAIEEELGVPLPDDVLVLLACRSEILACATGLALDAILDCAEDWSKGVPATHVAIGYVSKEPFAERAEDAHGSAFEVIAVPRKGGRGSAEIAVVRDGVEMKRTTLGAFAREKIAAWYGRDARRWLGALQTEPTLPLIDEHFRPQLVGELPPPPVKPERFVTHPKFGRGKVVESVTEHGDTKLTIDFETAGRKTLLEKYVEQG
jgi:hypothetical protein